MATSKTKPADVSSSNLEQETVGETPTVARPAAPSFGLCAGTVADLEQVDKTVDPFTGKVVTRADVK